MRQTIISVGHDGCDDPAGFDRSLRLAFARAGGKLVGAIAGTTLSDRWGAEPGAWYAVVDADPTVLRTLVLDVARFHGQEAVAITRGTCELAETSEGVARASA